MNTKTILKDLGLKKQQVEIYLACLELGQSSAGAIAKKAGIKRTYFYDLIDGLVSKGLVMQTIKKNKKYFYASDPDKLIEIERKKLREIERIVPQLKSIYNISGKKPKVSYYDGKAGLEEMYRDIYKNKEEVLAFTSEKFFQSEEKEMGQDFVNKRVGAGTPIRLIGPVSGELAKVKSRDSVELRQTKMLPRDIFASDIEIHIYGHKVNFINLNNKFGLIIENKEIASVLKSIFEIVWRGGFVID